MHSLNETTWACCTAASGHMYQTLVLDCRNKGHVKKYTRSMRPRGSAVDFGCKGIKLKFQNAEIKAIICPTFVTIFYERLYRAEKVAKVTKRFD
jgi:hypothetical protein